jgi:AcrR family transcriptional regulator
VTEVADGANVSRRTAYRYFPTGEQLIAEALLEAMRSDVEREIDATDSDADIATRMDRLVDAVHHLTVDKEHLLRQMIRLTIDRGPIEPGVPPRPSRRIDYIEQALLPLRKELKLADYDRLVHSIAVVIGIEARIVLRDICGLDDQSIVETERWAAHALLTAALQQRRPEPRRRPPAPTSGPSAAKTNRTSSRRR